MRSTTRKIATILISLLLVACGNGGGGGVVVETPSSGSTTVQSSPAGVTATPASVELTGATVTIPAQTTLKAADGTPVTGTVLVNASYGITGTALPVAEQTPPANTALKAYIDIVMTADGKTVKNVDPAIPVSMAVSLPNGTVVDIYSYSDAATGWVFESSTTVTAGAVNFNVSHFSSYGCFQRLTGLTGGSGGGVTVQ